MRRIRRGTLVASLAVGLLLWAKLILVTGHPRTAIAAPEASAAERPALPVTAPPERRRAPVPPRPAENPGLAD